MTSENVSNDLKKKLYTSMIEHKFLQKHSAVFSLSEKNSEGSMELL
jgi:hypothetical protein